MLLLVWAVFLRALEEKTGRNPLGILKPRDAKGEITKQQSEEMKKDL